MNRRWRRSIAFFLIWTMLSGVWGLPFGRVYAEGEAEPMEEVLISERTLKEGLHTSFETENFFEEKGDLSLQAEEEKVAEYSIEEWHSSEHRWGQVGDGYNSNPYFKVYVEEEDGVRRAYCYLPKSIYEQQPVSAGIVYERDYTYEWVEPDPEGAPLTTGTAIALDHPYDKGSGDYAYYRHEVCKVEIPMAEGDLPRQLHLRCKSKGQETGYPASSDVVWRITKSEEKEGTQRNKLSAPVAISSTGSFINTEKQEGSDVYQQGYGNNLKIHVYSPDMNEEPFCQAIDIRYTLDGTEPTAESPKIRRNQPSSNNILSEKIHYETSITYTKQAYDTQNAPERLPYDWKKGGHHVLKLKAFAPGLEASDTVTQEFELEKFPEHDLSQSRLLGCRTVVANLKDGGDPDIYYDSKIALRQETEGRIYEVAREFCNSRSESRFLPITLEVTNPEGYVLKPLNKSSRQLFFTLKNLRQGDLSLLELSEDKLEAYEIKDDGSIEKLEYPQGFNVQDVFGIKSLMFSVIPEDEQGQGVDPAVEKIVRHYIVVEKGSDNSVLSLEELKKKAKETVSYAKNLPQEVLEEESRQKIKDKTDVLQSALKDEAVTQERLLKELESLQEAILRLKAKEQEYGDAKALREKLKTLIEDSKGNKVRGFKNVAYLQYMFDPVVKQIEEGAYSNPEATAEELQQAIDTLQSAINSLPEVDEFAKQPDDLEDGIYKVPVQLRNFGDEGQPSMGNAAVGKTGYLFVENGKQRLRVQFVPLYVLGMWGHLIDAWYYNPEQEIVKPEDVSLLGERHHIIPVEKKNGIGLDMKPYDFLTIVDIPIEKFTESPRRYVSVSVDAMNLIFSGKPYSNDPKDLKDAVFAIDYNQITKLNDASEIVWEDEMKQDQTEGELDKRLNALIEKTNKAIKGSYPADKTEALKKMLEAAQNLAVNPSATNEQKEEMCESLEALLKEIGFEDNKPTPPGGGSYGYDVDTEATGEEL
ncbi:MAG: hypothetical protein Q3993_08040, partial [Filifactor alocis]|nr:hypothetical protein [Filifactor alocis]